MLAEQIEQLDRRCKEHPSPYATNNSLEDDKDEEDYQNPVRGRAAEQTAAPLTYIQY
jgi:hypothetical protein